MKKPQKEANKDRIQLYVDAELGQWLRKEAKKLGMTDSGFARLLVIDSYHYRNKANA